MKMVYGLLLSIMLTSASLAQTGKVSFRDDHTVLIDDKPFFPIGLYYCNEEFEDASGNLLQKLKDYGFNTLGYYRWGSPKWRAELDRAGKLGFKVWIRGHDGFAIESAPSEKAVLEQVRQTRDHPALLFWEFQDEPILNKVSIDGSRKGYHLVKREDPKHPLLVVEWPGAVNRLALWKDLGDIYAIDLYPIPRKRGYGRLPDHDITQIRDYIQAIRQARGDKPILMVLQAWAWEPLNDGVDGYPTPVESRFMAYQAVIHGAKGIHYYGQFHCSRPNSAAALSSTAADPAIQKVEFDKCLKLNRAFWDQHQPFFQELKKASSIFVLREARPGDQIRVLNEMPKGEHGIESMTKQADGRLYLLAVNADSRKREVIFQLPSSTRASEIEVLFENRRLQTKGGTFSDLFQAYGTHVYSVPSPP